MSRAVNAVRGPRASKACFYVGRDSSGNWVAQDEERLCYAFFAGRAQALRFAMFENGVRPRAAIMVPRVLELDLGGPGSRAKSDDQN